MASAIPEEETPTLTVPVVVTQASPDVDAIIRVNGQEIGRIHNMDIFRTDNAIPVLYNVDEDTLDEGIETVHVEETNMEFAEQQDAPIEPTPAALVLRDAVQDTDQTDPPSPTGETPAAEPHWNGEEMVDEAVPTIPENAEADEEVTLHRRPREIDWRLNATQHLFSKVTSACPRCKLPHRYVYTGDISESVHDLVRSPYYGTHHTAFKLTKIVCYSCGMTETIIPFNENDIMWYILEAEPTERRSHWVQDIDSDSNHSRRWRAHLGVFLEE